MKLKFALTAALFLWGAMAVQAETMRMAVTTSFHNSGLADVLLPEIKADLGLEVQLLVVGTGQAIRLGESGDVDAILVHSQKAEEAFVSASYGTHRREIMFNDFVLLGPSDDPAEIKQSGSAAASLKAISETIVRSIPMLKNKYFHKSLINRTRQILYRLEESILIGLLLVMIGMTVFQIFLRNLFGTGIIWGDPLVRVLVLWIGLLGAMVASRKGEHINIDIISRYLPERIKEGVNCATDIFTALVCAAAAYYSFWFVISEIS